MATKDATNTGELASFLALKDSERRAVILKSEGKTNEVITNHLNDEFALGLSIRTITTWFQPGGKLKQAYDEYNEALAVASLSEAKQLIKRATKHAAATMIAKLKSPDDMVGLRAAAALLNKYIPDRQVTLDHVPNDDIPPEIAEIAANLSEEEKNGPDKVDDAAVDSPDGQSPGAGDNQEVS